jgi:hypothetical protein
MVIIFCCRLNVNFSGNDLDWEGSVTGVSFCKLCLKMESIDALSLALNLS